MAQRTRELVEDVLAALAAPPETFEYLESQEDALSLVRNGDLGAVAFTGSRMVGRMLHDECATRATPIPMYGELASINPVVITQAALAERSKAIAEGLVNSFTLGVGQFCTKPGLVFVPHAGDFEAQVLHLLAEVPPHRMLEQRFASGYRDRLADTARQSWGVLHTPGAKAFRVGVGEALPGLLSLTSTDFVEHAEALMEECFGPMSVLVSYESVADLSRCLDKIDGQLTATLHVGESESPDYIADLTRRLARLAGRIVWNGWPTGVGIGAAMTHGGPWPSATTPHSSIGRSAITRFLRPITYQGAPEQFVQSWSAGL